METFMETKRVSSVSPNGDIGDIPPLGGCPMVDGPTLETLSPPITCRAWAGVTVPFPTVSPYAAEYRAAGLVPLDDIPGAWVSARIYDVVKPWFWLGRDA